MLIPSGEKAFGVDRIGLGENYEISISNMRTSRQRSIKSTFVKDVWAKYVLFRFAPSTGSERSRWSQGSVKPNDPSDPPKSTSRKANGQIWSNSLQSKIFGKMCRIHQFGIISTISLFSVVFPPCFCQCKCVSFCLPCLTFISFSQPLFFPLLFLIAPMSDCRSCCSCCCFSTF